MPEQQNHARHTQAAPHSTEHRFAYLLAGQLAMLLVYPLLAGDQPRPGLLAPFTIAVILASLYAILRDRRAAIWGAVLGTPAIVFGLLVSVSSEAPVKKAALAFMTLFFAFACATILKGVLTSPRVTSDTLYGAISSYLLAGVTWGTAYVLIEQTSPGSFRSSIDPGRALYWPDFTFFSFATLTTVGYGDMVPVKGFARSLALLEAVAGVMFPAVIIGRLIAFLVGGRSRQEHEG
ncbi:MAG TPA: ion channel [Terriglobales bacterium]|nr:ion channel [Terriglobales bacterium]